ncbi:MAG: hypothetical protein GKR88_02325 [Flavobacteriaceae bacterium]|nr:MAG: hypothetical protein GKR88_02325 [Flavobacteriaceae bacterium]
MRPITIFFFTFFGVLLISCQKEKKLKEYLVGFWQTTYIKIEMPTFQKSDTTSVFEDTFENHPERIVQSSYHHDGTFTTWSVDKEGERYGDTSGTWHIKGDSLYLDFFYNERNIREAYYVEKIKNGFKAISKYDRDKDGESDDLLLMKTKQIIKE